MSPEELQSTSGSGREKRNRAKLIGRRWVTALLLSLVLVLSCLSVSARGRASSQNRAAHGLLKKVELLKRKANSRTKIPVIIQVDSGYFAEKSRRGSDSNALRLVHGYSARLTALQVEALLESPVVEYVTLDMPVQLTSSVNAGEIVSPVTSLSQVREIVGASLTEASGNGVTVALVDSGISAHPDLKVGKRVKVSVDFTSGEPVVTSKDVRDFDRYGHGTHVAGIIGAAGSEKKEEAKGLAPGVDFVDLRVVGEDGWGLTSNLIIAIEWIIEHRDEYNIRVANLSLGHPPAEPYYRDPLCESVREMVEAGIVAVVSAGNLGVDDAGNPLWGGVNSPGTEPTAITVSPLNTQGTLTHSDDVATTYGSRGPAADNLFKPDISAPGNRIVSLLSQGSLIAESFPGLSIDGEYLVLSGASMATGVVSGIVAMMLEEKPELTPNLVKTILLVSAVKLESPSILEQGNGLVNAKVALDISSSLKVNKRELKKEVDPVWMLDGEEVWAGGAFAYGDQILYTPLWSEDAGTLFWGDGVFWADSVIWSDRKAWLNGIFWSDGVIWTDSVIWSDRMVRGQSNLAWTDGIYWADGVVWTDGVIWSDRMVRASGVIWSDGAFRTGSIIWSDGLVWTDGVIWSDRAHVPPWFFGD